ncbi:MAG TPA: PAS domain S-box protein [Phototrophicaceae bacterium]|nr:PAS domain S-box protein [Phototrophicaceae bacterium]
MPFLKVFLASFPWRPFKQSLRSIIEPLPTVPEEYRPQCRLLAALLLSLSGVFMVSLPLFLLMNPGMAGADARLLGLVLGILLTIGLSQFSRRGYYQSVINTVIVAGSVMIFMGAALSQDANEQLIILQNLIIPMLFAALYLSGKAAVLVLGLQLICLTLVAPLTPTITAQLAFSQFRFHLGAGTLLLLMAHFYRRMHAAQEAYRAEQDARYRLAVENAQDAVYTLSPEGKITSLNTAAETISGWPVAELLGRPFAELVHPDDLPLAAALFQESLTGKKQPLFELRLRAKSGCYFQAELHSSPVIQRGQVVATTGVIRDIDERKRLEAELRHSEQLSRTLIQHFPNGTVLLFDHEMRFQLVGGETMTQLGLSPETLVGQPLAASLPPRPGRIV